MKRSKNCVQNFWAEFRLNIDDLYICENSSKWLWRKFLWLSLLIEIKKIKVRMIAFSLLCITWASAQNHDQEAMFFCANNCKVKTKEFKSLENLRLARSYIFRPKNVLLKKKLKFKMKPRFKRQYFQHYLRERVKKFPKQATVKTDFIRMTKIAVPIFTAG